MELFLNATSPYARMVRIAVLEKGLTGMVTLRWCDPWADDAALLKANPAGRIPSLITEDGTALSESFMIAFYLDTLGSSQSLIPTFRMDEVLHFAGLGQSLMDTAFTTVISKKYLDLKSAENILDQRRSRAIKRILDQLELELDDSQLTYTVTLGDISIAVALDYLEFRLPETGWANGRPRLEAWHHRISNGKNFQLTTFR